MITPYGKYYLYRHVRLDKNEPFYIGVGTKRGKLKTDYISAYYRAFTNDTRNKYWHNITSLSEYDVDILLESDDRDFILSKEVEFISLYGRKCLGSGTLVNLDGGGKNQKRPDIVISKTLATKAKRGNLGNAKNLLNWMNSEDYKNPRARYIYMYSADDGSFIKKFNSLKNCADYLGIKGSVSYLIQKCHSKSIYISKYIFSWVDNGEYINLNDYNLSTIFSKAIKKICPNTGDVVSMYRKTIDAAKENNINYKTLSWAVCNNKKYGGFFWKRDDQKQTP